MCGHCVGKSIGALAVRNLAAIVVRHDEQAGTFLRHRGVIRQLQANPPLEPSELVDDVLIPPHVADQTPAATPPSRVQRRIVGDRALAV